MNSSYFGSFSKRTFCDLFELNARSVHNHLHVFEIINKEVINHRVVSLPIHEILEDEGHVPSCFKKLKNSSYMLGVLVENNNKINTLGMYKYNKVHLLDTQDSRDITYCKERNKEFIYVELFENSVSVLLGKKQCFYMDSFCSISHTPMSEFEAVKMHGHPALVNITNLKKD